MRDISQSQWVNCDLTRRYVGLNLSQQRGQGSQKTRIPKAEQSHIKGIQRARPGQVS